MTNSKSKRDGDPGGDNSRNGLSWRAMLALLALALIAAAVVAYFLVDPFFHQHAPLP